MREQEPEAPDCEWIAQSLGAKHVLAPAELRERVVQRVRVELAHCRRWRAIQQTAWAAAAVLAWLNLSLTASLAGPAYPPRSLSPTMVASSVAEIRALAPELSESDAIRYAIGQVVVDWSAPWAGFTADDLQRARNLRNDLLQ